MRASLTIGHIITKAQAAASHSDRHHALKLFNIQASTPKGLKSRLLSPLDQRGQYMNRRSGTRLINTVYFKYPVASAKLLIVAKI